MRVSDSNAPLRVFITGPTHQAAMLRPVEWLIDEGHEVWVLGRCRLQNIDPDSYHYLSSPAAKIYSILQKLFPEKWARNVFVVLGTIEAKCLSWTIRPQISHAHFLNKEAMTFGLAGIKPLVVSVWGGLNIEKEYTPKDLNKWKWVIRSFRNISSFIAEHRLLIPKIKDVFGSTARADHMTLGINIDHFRPNLTKSRSEWRKRFRIGPSEVVFLSPRGFTDFYHQTGILESFAKASSDFNNPTRLVFIELKRNTGKVKNFKKTFIQKANQLGISSRVHWVSQQQYKDMPGVYALADVILNFPESDIFPSTLLEVAACEKLIVSHRLPSYNGSFLEECAIMIEKNDYRALTDTMISLVNRGLDHYKTRIAKGRELVAEQFDVKKEKVKFLQLIYELSQV